MRNDSHGYSYNVFFFCRHDSAKHCHWLCVVELLLVVNFGTVMFCVAAQITTISISVADSFAHSSLLTGRSVWLHSLDSINIRSIKSIRRHEATNYLLLWANSLNHQIHRINTHTHTAQIKYYDFLWPLLCNYLFYSILHKNRNNQAHFIEYISFSNGCCALVREK